MILTETVTIYQPTSSKLGDGTVVNSFSSLGSFACSFQPAALTRDVLQAFGLTDLDSNAKKIFFNAGVLVKSGFRIAGADGLTYIVRGVNNWPIHVEALAVPVQGVAR